MPKLRGRLLILGSFGSKAEQSKSQVAEVYWSRPTVDHYPFDAEYLRLLKANDPEIVAHFNSYFNRRLKAKLRSRGLSDADAADVIQETFLRTLVAVQKDEIRNPVCFGAWLSQTCDNVLREKWRDNERNFHLDLDGLDLPDHATGLEILVLRKEMRIIVQQVLEDLRPKDRNLLRAQLFDQLGREEMCTRFGVSGDHLRLLLHRARKNFAAACKARGLDMLQN